MTQSTQQKYRQAIEVPDTFWDALVFNQVPTGEYLAQRTWVGEVRNVTTRNGKATQVRDVRSTIIHSNGQQFSVKHSLWGARALSIGDQLLKFCHGKETLITYDFDKNKESLVVEEYENNKGELCVEIKLPLDAYPFYRAQGLGKASSDNGVGFPPADNEDSEEEKRPSVPASSPTPSSAPSSDID